MKPVAEQICLDIYLSLEHIGERDVRDQVWSNVFNKVANGEQDALYVYITNKLKK